MEATPRETAPRTVEERKRRPLLVEMFVRLAKEKPLGMVGGVIVLALLIAGVFADIIAPYGMNEIDLTSRLAAPTEANHLLGTDNLGRDLLSRIIYGARISMYVGLGVSALAVVLSTIIGIVSGYFGGRVDIIIQRFIDAFMCIPGLFLILTIMAVLGPGLWQVIVVLGILYGIADTRVVRSAVIGIKENVYVEAAAAIGVPNIKILTRHILPNIMAPIIVLFTVTMGAGIIAEASISFLGFGIPPPTPSWGGMLSGKGREYMILAPWMALWPGLALAIVVYGINMLGDAMRDILDPRLRGGLGRYGRVKSEEATKEGEPSASEGLTKGVE